LRSKNHEKNQYKDDEEEKEFFYVFNSMLKKKIQKHTNEKGQVVPKKSFL